MKNLKIRLANENDCSSILHIYTPYIMDTVISFECQVPTDAEFCKRMANVQKQFPWLVCEIDNEIVGYAYASRHREREAYDWSVDVSVYIDPRFHRNNIGKSLYSALLELLKLQGYYNVYAGVAIPNIKSEGFHESFGFVEIGTYHSVGYKFGNWHDVKWYELKINNHIQSPVKPKPIATLNNSEEFDGIIKRAQQILQMK